MMTRILAADIGGTKTLVRLNEVSNTTQVLFEKYYASRDFSSFSLLLEDFLASDPACADPIDVVCCAVAGPVAKDGQSANVTNLPWQLKANVISKQLRCKSIRLINDFQAVGYGIATLKDSDLITLQTGQPQTHGRQLVIGAGTGLGVAQLILEPTLHIIASEAGHSDFAPADHQQRSLLEYLSQRMDHVSLESVLSGNGLIYIYAFLRDSKELPENPALRQAIDEHDGAAMISEFAIQQLDPLALAALELFASVYGAAAGNIALLTLPYGGVYIAGGIAPKIISVLKSGMFINAFNNKNKMTTLLQTIPVHVVMDTQVGLQGAVWAATH